MTQQNANRLLPAPGEVKVRLYGQGVGDCFLLAFPRQDPADPCYLVIDCGVAKSTPGKASRTRSIVADLAAATGNHIHVLAITHQHYDHVSGFLDAPREWSEIAIDALYLPWTEASAARGEHSRSGDFRRVLDEAAKAALLKAQRSHLLGDQPALKAQADFLGFDLDGDGLADEPGDIDDAMDFARWLARGKVRYFGPGDVFVLPGTESHGYVLGPPRPDATTADRKKKLIELLSDEEEMYSYADTGLLPDSGRPGGARSFALSEDRGLPALASAVLAYENLNRDGDEGFCPFSREVRLDWDEAMASPFFIGHYGNDSKGHNGGWRRADFDWLGGAATLALRAGGFTNNVSLVLAFDLPGSKKMLLFPGDAQVGNWLSWHSIGDWNFCDDSAPADPPRGDGDTTLMQDLLGRVAFYKVGHHGSHNATLRDKGLELMRRPDLTAFIPVSVPVAQDLMGYCPMPFYPVVRALQKKTGGRVFLPNGLAVEPLPPGATQQSLRTAAGIVPSSGPPLPPKIKKDENGQEVQLEGEVPLYLELTLKA